MSDAITDINVITKLPLADAHVCTWFMPTSLLGQTGSGHNFKDGRCGQMLHFCIRTKWFGMIKWLRVKSLINTAATDNVIFHLSRIRFDPFSFSLGVYHWYAGFRVVNYGIRAIDHRRFVIGILVIVRLVMEDDWSPGRLVIRTIGHRTIDHRIIGHMNDRPITFRKTDTCKT